MIERIRFSNFKALKSADLKLGPFNVIVGPNGSGKSTVFQALTLVGTVENGKHSRLVTIGCDPAEVSVKVDFSEPVHSMTGARATWSPNGQVLKCLKADEAVNATGAIQTEIVKRLRNIRVYSFDAAKVAEAVLIQPNVELQRNGANLAAVLDHLRNSDEEAYDALRVDLTRWIPEYDNIIFETPQQGQRSFKLRQAGSGRAIASSDLSEGTLLTLCLLTLVYNSSPPVVVCLEEPDRALHPRLLRDVQNTLYRLSFPDQFGLSRKPVQVIATTHSPFFLDLFKDHPEQVVVAEKQQDGTATFKSLSDDEELRAVIGDAPLGEVWYSGVLGGVPVSR